MTEREEEKKEDEYEHDSSDEEVRQNDLRSSGFCNVLLGSTGSLLFSVSVLRRSPEFLCFF